MINHCMIYILTIYFTQTYINRDHTFFFFTGETDSHAILFAHNILCITLHETSCKYLL